MHRLLLLTLEPVEFQPNYKVNSSDSLPFPASILSTWKFNQNFLYHAYTSRDGRDCGEEFWFTSQYVGIPRFQLCIVHNYLKLRGRENHNFWDIYWLTDGVYIYAFNENERHVEEPPSPGLNFHSTAPVSVSCATADHSTPVHRRSSRCFNHLWTIRDTAFMSESSRLVKLSDFLIRGLNYDERFSAQ